MTLTIYHHHLSSNPTSQSLPVPPNLATGALLPQVSSHVNGRDLSTGPVSDNRSSCSRQASVFTIGSGAAIQVVRRRSSDQRAHSLKNHSPMRTNASIVQGKQRRGLIMESVSQLPTGYFVSAPLRRQFSIMSTKLPPLPITKHV